MARRIEVLAERAGTLGAGIAADSALVRVYLVGGQYTESCTHM